MQKRVVITGIGAICGLGPDARTIWSTMLAGKPPRSKIGPNHFEIGEAALPYTRRDKTIVDTACISPLSNAELGNLAGIKAQRIDDYDRHQLFGLVAAIEAMRGIDVQSVCDPERFGISGGTGAGGLLEMHHAHMKLARDERLDMRSNLRLLPNLHVAYPANMFGLKGPGTSHCSACAAASHALIDAARIICCDEADMMLVVGSDVSVSPYGFGSFTSQQAVWIDSWPYRRDRKGFLMGEGGGALVLEEYEHAKNRGAQILAEVKGWGATTDGSGKTTEPDPSGGARSAMLALRMADLSPLELGAIKAHGTGTPIGDPAELKGIQQWAGADFGRIPITAPKSYSGHLLGAAGALEAVLCVQMLVEELIPPTYGLTQENLDPACMGFAHVMHEAEPLMDRAVLANSFGFGGTNASLIFTSE